MAQRAGARRRVCHVVDGNPRKMLAERLELNSPHGRRVIGILLFQDLAVVPLLILYPAPGQGGEAVARELLIALAKAGLVLFLLSTVGREGKCILDRVQSGSARVREAAAAAESVVSGDRKWSRKLSTNRATGSAAAALRDPAAGGPPQWGKH